MDAMMYVLDDQESQIELTVVHWCLGPLLHRSLALAAGYTFQLEISKNIIAMIWVLDDQGLRSS